MSSSQISMRLVLILIVLFTLLEARFSPSKVNANTSNRTYYVDTTGDAGISANPNACESDLADSDCTLRQAIQKANADGGASTIDFSLLPTSDPNYSGTTKRWTIKPLSQLPSINDANGGTTVKGRLDNVEFLPRIVLDGSALNSDGNGFQIASANNVINGMIIVNFKGNTLTTGNGIRITGINAKDNQIVGCYIGSFPRELPVAPAIPPGNQQAGVRIDNAASRNRVGAPGTNRNFINGNGYDKQGNKTYGDGIRISESYPTDSNATSNNVVEGNYIGIGVGSALDEAALPNNGHGIQISDSSYNTIGGNAGARNMISGNGLSGIVVTGAGSTNNTIYGNYVGTASDGFVDIGNTESGIVFSYGASNNTVGGGVNPVVISGNGGYGVLITDADTNNNTIRDSYIGLNESGDVAVANDKGGVRIQNDATNNHIGVSGGRNIISGNTGYGISLGRVDTGILVTNDNIIQNNILGLDQLAKNPVPNTTGGIEVDSSANNTIIGGLASGEGNVISDNTGPGIVVRAQDVSNTTIQGNIIGLKRSVTNGIFDGNAGNDSHGIYVEPNAKTVTIGGDATQKNRIAYNLGDGVQVNTGASNITITFNDVTTNTLNGINLTGVTAPIINDNQANANGTAAASTGILVSSAPNAQILRNTANLNTQHGIQVTSANNLQLNTNVVKQNTADGIQVATSNNLQLNNNLADTNNANGIQVASANIATLDSNTVNNNTANGLIALSSDALKITSLTTSLNKNSGAVIGESTRVTLDKTTAVTNTLNGISLVNTKPFTVTNSPKLHSNGSAGLKAVGSFNHSQIRKNDVKFNGANGILLESAAPSATQYLTMTGNLARENTGSGLFINGNISKALIQQNSFYFNTVDGAHVGGAATPHPQQITFDNNSFTGNGIPVNASLPVGEAYYGLGIVLEPNTIAAGNAANPNHDIDPPFNLIAWDDGRFTGQVLANGSPDACLPTPTNPAPNPAPSCKLQFFSTDSERLDGQGFSLLNSSTIGANGYFTATLGFVPKQLAVTATDQTGNTSEFAVYDSKPSLAFDAAQAKQASPGETVTFVHKLTNTGNVAFTSIGLGFEARKNGVLLTSWDVSANPTGTFSLKPGETKTVTTTVKLPLGPNDEVAAGSVANIRLVATSGSTENAVAQAEVTDTVTVLPRVVLDVQPTALSGSAKPGQVVTYPHTVTNKGNVDTSVALSYQTLVNNGNAPTWTTVLEPTSLTLKPGQSAGFTVKVTVSEGSQEGTQAVTTVTLIPSTNGTQDPTQTKTVVDTTTATLEQAATLLPARQEQYGAATEVVSFEHYVQNTSNGTATFKLQAVSSQGSVISFRSIDDKTQLVSGSTFTLAQGDQFDFLMDVTVDRRLLPGQKDVITVVLLDAQGGVIGGASAQDTIIVQTGVMYPRVFMPVVKK